MADVFISYNQADRAWVGPLADALSARGFEVWWDALIQPGDVWRTRIDQELAAAHCVVVVWSQDSVRSAWVRSEADEALQADKLFSVKRADCHLPKPFTEVQFTDLSGWDAGAGEAAGRNAGGRDAGFDALVASLTQRIGASEQAFRQSRALIKRLTNVDVDKRLSFGDVSTVFKGHLGPQDVIVKVLRDTPIPEAFKDIVGREVKETQDLTNPAFLGISDVTFEDGDVYLVQKLARGATVSHHVRPNRSEPPKPLAPSDVVDVLSQLAEALVDAGRIGLQHLRISPSEVFLEPGLDGAPPLARLSPINFAYLLSRVESRRDRFILANETSPYTAPELWRRHDWFFDRVEAARGRDFDAAVAPYANQFSLGVLALYMLEGAPPVEIHCPADAGDFLSESPFFADRAVSGAWRNTARDLRGLGRIVAGMLAEDPAKRWSDMGQVADLLAPLSQGRRSRERVANEARRVYQQHCFQQYDFYTDFYGDLFDENPRMAALFSDNMDEQKKKLDLAIGQLFNFARGQAEPTPLTPFVAGHVDMALSAQDFETFGEKLLDTLGSRLADGPERAFALASWDVMIWPGIDYMIKACAAEAA